MGMDAESQLRGLPRPSRVRAALLAALPRPVKTVARALAALGLLAYLLHSLVVPSSSSHAPSTLARCKPRLTPLSAGLKEVLQRYDLSKPVILRPTGESTPYPDPPPFNISRKLLRGTMLHQTDATFFQPSSSVATQPRLQAIDVPHYAKRVHLPRTAPRADAILFGYVTTPSRAISMAPIWAAWLAPPPSRTGGVGAPAPRCLIVLPPGTNSTAIPPVREALASHRIECEFALGRARRYEVRMLEMVRHMRTLVRRKGWKVEWYVWSDDDTLYLDIRTLRRMLGRYDSGDDRLVGSSTEGVHQQNEFMRMAFGGAGIFVSASLMRKMDSIHTYCMETYHDDFGGDGMLTKCAAHALRIPNTSVLSEDVGLHQSDITGDATGFLQAGYPIMSLHHTIPLPTAFVWALLFPKTHHLPPLARIGILQKAASIFGGDMLFSRYSFEGGRVLFVLGYSITVWEDPPTQAEYGLVEHTWRWYHEVHWATRPVVPEGTRPPEKKHLFFRNDVKGALGRGTRRSFFLSDIEAQGGLVRMEFTAGESCGGAKGTGQSKVVVWWDWCEVEVRGCRTEDELSRMRLARD